MGTDNQPENEPGNHGGIDTDLALIFAQIRQLHELASDVRAAEDGDQRYDFNIRWGVLLSGRLQRLIYYERRGELSGEQRQRFERLRDQLYDAAPRARKLGLADPIRALDPQARKKRPKV